MAVRGVTIEFQVRRRADVPQVGQRKRMRVNGELQTLICQSVDAKLERVEQYHDEAKPWEQADPQFVGIRLAYSGTAVFMPYRHLTTVSEEV